MFNSILLYWAQTFESSSIWSIYVQKKDQLNQNIHSHFVFTFDYNRITYTSKSNGIEIQSLVCLLMNSALTSTQIIFFVSTFANIAKKSTYATVQCIMYQSRKYVVYFGKHWNVFFFPSSFSNKPIEHRIFLESVSYIII